jgi:hypothetical protein
MMTEADEERVLLMGNEQVQSNPTLAPQCKPESLMDDPLLQNAG